MKKLFSVLLALSMLLVGAMAMAESETVMIQSLNGAGEEIELTVPANPKRIAILDMASLDILNSLGVSDRVVGSATTKLPYLSDIVNAEDVANLGTIKEADLEAVMACEPDVIFIGGRLSKNYDALSEIAPVVYLSTDSDPHIYWQGQGYIETAVLDAAHRLPPGGVALYYLKPGQTDYSEAVSYTHLTLPTIA